MRLRWAGLAAFAFAAGSPMAPAVAVAPHKSAAATDWTRAVALTEAGGYRMGNPAAKVKLVEYGSLTCPHCAHFAAEAMPEIRSLVRSGKLSFEYRNFVLNGVDVAATLIARCGGAKSFYPLVESIYASQPKWVAAFAALSPEEIDSISALPAAQRLYRLAQETGLDRLAAGAGLSAARTRQCLADPKALDQLDRIHKAGVQLGVAGTPTFLIDGEKKSGGWAEIEPDIRRALGSGG
jgi:protein-disulfide isomerase